MSQNLIVNSSPAARNLFLVVSNCTIPTAHFPSPTYVRLTAPSLSFHSTRYESPSLLVPHENSLQSDGNQGRPIKDPIELPQGPITCAKKIQEALSSYIQREWIQELAQFEEYPTKPNRNQLLLINYVQVSLRVDYLIKI